VSVRRGELAAGLEARDIVAKRCYCRMRLAGIVTGGGGADPLNVTVKRRRVRGTERPGRCAPTSREAWEREHGEERARVGMRETATGRTRTHAWRPSRLTAARFRPPLRDRAA
jgi:hypothetical protein